MPASLEQQWKPEEDNLVRKLVSEGFQLKDMPAFIQGRSRRAIECRAYILGLKSGKPRSIHTKNELFWNIPNPINSYFAGILAADGSLDDYRHTLRWECESGDREYMEEFVRLTQWTGTIKDFPKKSPRSDYVAIHSRICISSCQQWNADLAKHFNVIQNKVHRLQPPNLSNDLLKCCYLIGITDGDGCISIGKHKNGSLIPVFSYTSASRDIMQWIRVFVDEKFPFYKNVNTMRGKVASSSNGNYHHCRIYGIKAIKLFDLLKEINVPKFKRKWSSPAFLTLVDQYHQKYPDFFTPEMELSFDSNGNIVRTKNLISSSSPITSIAPCPAASNPAAI